MEELRGEAGRRSDGRKRRMIAFYGSILSTIIVGYFLWNFLCDYNRY